MLWITVRYPGECAECEAEIEAGNRAVLDEGKLYCADMCGQDIAGDDPGDE